MSDKDIKESYRHSAQRMRGDGNTFASGLDSGTTNDPEFHKDLHEKFRVSYDRIETSPSMEEIHSGPHREET